MLPKSLTNPPSDGIAATTFAPVQAAKLLSKKKCLATKTADERQY